MTGRKPTSTPRSSRSRPGRRCFSLPSTRGRCCRRRLATPTASSVTWTGGTGPILINEAHWAASAIAAGTGTPSGNTVLANDFNGAPYNYDVTVSGSNLLLVYGGSSKTNQVTWPAGSPGSLTTHEIKTPTSTTIPPGTVAWV